MKTATAATKINLLQTHQQKIQPEEIHAPKTNLHRWWQSAVEPTSRIPIFNELTKHGKNQQDIQ
jgi:hypothetical protein